MVLIIDDDAGILNVLRLVFVVEGYRVMQAADGAQALQRLDEGEPDAIVLDLQMAGMDGREFYRELRARGSGCPVVIASAHGARRAQGELAAEASISKPFDPEELVALVNRLRAGH
jgi:DNA-binding response OmpR family regulator